MKKTNYFWRPVTLLVLTSLFFAVAVHAQDTREKRLTDDTEKAKSNFTRSNKQMQDIFDKAYGYAIFPNVGKGAAGIGGAAGSGILYEQGKMTGSIKMKQLTVGLQIGGQSFREVILFEDKDALDRFKSYAYEFTAQTSAAVINATDTADPEYTDGVLVFTQKKTGLMYDASVGGQKFDYTSF